MTDSATEPSLGRFVLRVAGWLVPAFLVWYAAATIFAWPIVLLTRGVTGLVFGSLVRDVEQHRYFVTIVSTLGAAATTEHPAGGAVSVDLNTLLYSFGFPMLAALTLAARQPHALRTLALGYVALAPCVTFGLVAEFLRHIVFGLPASIAAQAGFGAVEREVIAFAYQFGSLILPTVAPAVFWVLTHRRFLERFAGARAAGSLAQ
ncbi:MAG TPA: exosortase H-associated membrane protein [Casimicrobiaceae bacterium]|nr:exosortase H-associated membrane protein [Casimicrobiaceae bacterium]